MGRGQIALNNGIMDYPWGGRHGLAEWAAVKNPDAVPQAELWVGAHPRCPSVLAAEGTALHDWIAEDPGRLGQAREHFDRLPFLLKILAADAPLSIQCHPDAVQAKAGFEREEKEQVPEGQRCYRDPHPKPELLLALTPFRALHSFRPLNQIGATLRGLDGAESLAVALAEGGLRGAVAAWLELDPEQVARIHRACLVRPEGPGATVLELAQHHPDDVGILGPLFLNELTLRPGEALFLGPGRLHAYLGGVGVELMGNSDNVLRGGLTTKPLNRQGLLNVSVIQPEAPWRIAPQPRNGWLRYETPTPEFELESLPPQAEGTGPRHPDRPEVLFSLAEPAELQLTGEAVRVLRPPQALWVEAGSPTYRIRGPRGVIRASIPLHPNPDLGMKPRPMAPRS